MGVDINYNQGKDGLSLLHRCIIQGSKLPTIKILLDNGADINLKNLRGLSPLHAASQKGDLSIIQLLLDYHSNPLQKDFENKTCLHWSAIGGHIDCIDFFVRNNVLINLRDNYGYTALHYAVKHNHYYCIKYLLNCGADPLLADNQGLRPIDLLIGYKDKKLSPYSKKIEKLLRKNGGHKLSPDVFPTPLGGKLPSINTINNLPFITIIMISKFSQLSSSQFMN